MDKEFIIDYNSNMKMSDMLIKYEICMTTYFKLLKNLNLHRCRRNTVTNRLLNLCNIPIISTPITKPKLPLNIKIIDHNIPKVPIVSVTKNSINELDSILEKCDKAISESKIQSDKRKIIKNKTIVN